MNARGPGRLVTLLALALASGLTVVMLAVDDRHQGADTPDLRGSSIEVLAVWSGIEQEHFEAVLGDFERRTGAVVRYTPAGHAVPEALTERAAAGTLPDVAFLPQPGLLPSYAERGWILPVDDLLGADLTRRYPAVWRGLAAVGGRAHGVWFKAANKSVIWYDVDLFERLGVVPPDDLDGLQRLARSVTAAGRPAFAVAGAAGWTLTDWFENIYLQLAGPARYDLAAHRLPWTDPSVIGALEEMKRLLAPELVAGGTQRALATGFEASVADALGPNPSAAMVFEGDFVAGALAATGGAALGVEADTFPFPAAGGSTGDVVGGGDLAVLMRSSPAGEAFIRFLATPEAASLWAAQGGFLSPNLDMDLGVYPDDSTRAMGRAVLEAGDNFRFDLSDLQPGSFGAATDRGMRPLLQRFLATGDVASTVTALEAEATAAFGA